MLVVARRAMGRREAAGVVVEELGLKAALPVACLRPRSLLRARRCRACRHPGVLSFRGAAPSPAGGHGVLRRLGSVGAVGSVDVCGVCRRPGAHRGGVRVSRSPLAMAVTWMKPVVAVGASTVVFAAWAPPLWNGRAGRAGVWGGVRLAAAANGQPAGGDRAAHGYQRDPDGVCAVEGGRGVRRGADGGDWGEVVGD